MSQIPKQAVLLIHGIGEQRPMDTLRGFVDTVWKRNPEVHHPYATTGVFSKPDDISGSFELRRLTTTQDRNGVRTDFFEFYWAHMMEDTTMGHVLPWLRHLLLRRPGSLPRALQSAWWVLSGMVLIAAFFGLLTVLPEAWRFWHLPKWISGAVGLLATLALAPVLKKFVGDAARYLTPLPVNIHRRQEIRAKGVEVLNKLHASGDYQRIILAGHSLGSVIGYDILTHAWPAYAAQLPSQTHPVLDQVEALVHESPLDIDAFQQGQAALGHELRANGCPWLVTDFITMGSPLTHAEVLMAKDREDLESKQAERELPTCPPQLEASHFSYPAASKMRRLHYAAVFGPTRWSNVYFPARAIVHGDIVGGPLQGVFGRGIRDCPVTTTLWGGFLSHTNYWTPESKQTTGKHVQVLQYVMNLLNEERVSQL
ncbi:hypothetical protein DNI29_22360 [Hymenobacter sediminis]|uniref:hypothetical protein n=1 Tax=Hymenobacter sediminis TaxID=2218621 RepID=UPI000DA6CFC8|nr:hypothetical protein [Hymenobacter sediminis]RPD44142.1 hypothetical protein DNI29_22360 [Hymenobacter sediminis]